MKELDAVIRDVGRGVERAVQLHGEWRDYSRWRVLWVVASEFLEVAWAIIRNKRGPHGMEDELRDLAVVSVKGMVWVKGGKPISGGKAMIRKGQKIRIKDNLRDVLTEMGFDKHTVVNMATAFSGTEQTAHSIWKDGDQEYVTVDLCCEIPIQCCEAIG